MKRFKEIIKGWNTSTIFGKRSILDVWKGSECACAVLFKNKWEEIVIYSKGHFEDMHFFEFLRSLVFVFWYCYSKIDGTLSSMFYSYPARFLNIYLSLKI